MNDCIEYPRYRDKKGYGRVWFCGKVWRAHRLAYMWLRGTDPGDMLVCHTCDNPSCVNPDHLFPGTPLDNVRDMDGKGRRVSPAGDGHWCGKLSSDDVGQIRHLLASGMKQREIANIFNVSHVSIGNIKRSRTWSTSPREEDCPPTSRSPQSHAGVTPSSRRSK